MENIVEVYDDAGNVDDIVITLNQYETYIIATRVPPNTNTENPPTSDPGSPYPITNRDALIGMLIESDKNIAVFDVTVLDNSKRYFKFTWHVEKYLNEGPLKNCWLTTIVSEPVPMGSSI